ncbi:interferon-induced protein 44-like isoform X2 [Neoarius graeffei]|uniref:interferon-induced protein 44-like isoform X2 n=1 Tax=Neoarius graeffei TaxID=443677 RepID=UPI00298D0FB1|nr:interferon-induced protein 44-like isoform X2 [Neoarius graeffei]
MGSSLSKPEFVTVLGNKQVKCGETMSLCCEANTEYVTATWTKNGQKLCCVQDKHFIKNNSTMFSLKIVKVEEADHGEYTINLKNKKGEISCSAHVTVELKKWRYVDFNQERLLNNLKAFRIVSEVPELHFLLYGLVGAGKSSTINTIRTIFKGRQLIECLAAALSGESQTKNFYRFEVPKEKGSFPFAFYDIMGLQANGGVHTDDIISAVKGHMKAGYECNVRDPLSDDSTYYLKNPTLSDRMHCLLCIVAADTIGLIGNDVLHKFQTVSKAARNIGVPQVVLMTKVNNACVMTKDNLHNIYKSKKIKAKMHECSQKLGVPVNCIFPVWNYHEETRINEDMNCLMLEALTHAVYCANDYVKHASEQL